MSAPMIRSLIRWLLAPVPYRGFTRRDPFFCQMCEPPRRLPVFMLLDHMEHEHGIDPREIIHATVVDQTDEP